MPLLGIEPLADAALSQLQQYLPAKINALAPTFVPALPATVPMPMPVDYVFDDRSTFLKGYPVVQVREVRTPIRADDLRFQDHMHRLEVGIWVQRPEPEYLSRLLNRYLRCALEVLHERRKAGAFYNATGLDLRFDGEDISYTPTLPQDGLFVRGLFVPMRFENRGAEAA